MRQRRNTKNDCGHEQEEENIQYGNATKSYKRNNDLYNGNGILYYLELFGK